MSSSGWLALGLLLALVAILLHAGVLFVVAVSLLLIAATTALWSRYCLDRLEYQRSFSVRRAFCGEEIDFSIRLVNRKPLPLAWVIVDDEFPDDLTLQG